MYIVLENYLAVICECLDLYFYLGKYFRYNQNASFYSPFCGQIMYIEIDNHTNRTYFSDIETSLFILPLQYSTSQYSLV